MTTKIRMIFIEIGVGAGAAATFVALFLHQRPLQVFGLMMGAGLYASLHLLGLAARDICRLLPPKTPEDASHDR